MQQNIKDDLTHYEFHTYQPNADGNICMYGFLTSMLSCIASNKQAQY